MLQWLKNYRRDMLVGDISGGLLVALMMLPQGMAYALMAGLPAVVGLYASIVPALAYALVGRSAIQSVGPMAITSLMTATALAGLAAPGSAEYVLLAAQLALLVGVLLCLCAALRLGFLSNLLSRPVLAGFTCATTLLIIQAQLPALLGGPLVAPNRASCLLGLSTLGLLLLARYGLPPVLQRLGLSAKTAVTLSRLAPVISLVLAGFLVSALEWQQAGVQVLGALPAGMPALQWPVGAGHWRELATPALLIAFMVFLSSQSVAQMAAEQHRGRFDSNHELFGQGAANLASALFSGFPVSGGLSRSAANMAAGANSQLASVISAALLMVALWSAPAWLAWLPLPALAATIIVAVLGMFDLGSLRAAWRYDRRDGIAWLATAAGVLTLGIEAGVLIGVLVSVGSLLARASRPHIAVLGRMPDGQSFRNVQRYQVQTLDNALLLRVDAGLFFGNAGVVVQRVEQLLPPAAEHVVLVMSAVNLVDYSGLLALSELNRNLLERGVKLHLAEIKGPVMDRLQHSALIQQQLSGQLFGTTSAAFSHLSQG
ncbi:SulP family sulfate permease [Pseudomonas sp. TE3786]